LFSGTTNGLIWCTQISRLIVDERSRHTYDLLSMLPQGALGTLWTLSAGCIYFQRRLHRAQEIHEFLMRTIIVIGFVFLLDVFLGRSQSPLIELISLTSHVILLLTLLHLDFIQSIILALLIGMLTPLFSRDRIEVRLWAVGGFLGLQLLVYAAAFFIALSIPLPLALTQALPASLFILAGFLLALFGLRESCMLLIWRSLLRRTNTGYFEDGKHDTLKC
jgi:hypothetical protein